MSKKLKESQMNLRINKEFLVEIRSYCKENNINLSEEIRVFLQSIINKKVEV